MIEFERRDSGRSNRFALVMAGCLFAAFGYLALFAGFTGGSDFATFGAMMAIPFCVGALFTHGAGTYSPLGCLVTPAILLALCVGLVNLGMEGLICVAMILPIWIIAGLGGCLTALLSRSWMVDESEARTRTYAVGLAVLPFVLIYAETAAPPEWETREVKRSVIVEASPSQIWPQLVSIPDIAPGEGLANPTQDWLGVPRPSSARLVERNGRFIREAQWGDRVRFEEIVTDLSPHNSIGWNFAFPDGSVQAHTDRHINPDGDLLKIETGRYDLARRKDGRTTVTLTTSYRMRTRLGWYLGWWGELLLGDVQENVLHIVRARSEAG